MRDREAIIQRKLSQIFRGTPFKYAMQLGRAEGLRIIADAWAADEALVRGLGADVVVARGPDVAARMRQAVPGGVDALLDAAVMGAPVLAAVRDGGQVIAVRSFAGQTERGITVEPGAMKPTG